MKRFVIVIILVFSFTFDPTSCAGTVKENELPLCRVITHCAIANLEVANVEDSFNKISELIVHTPRTKIIEKTENYIHAEAQTKWMRYTDDLLVKALPDKKIIQLRSESRVGIGDNGVNKKRLNDLVYRLSANQLVN